MSTNAQEVHWSWNANSLTSVIILYLKFTCFQVVFLCGTIYVLLAGIPVEGKSSACLIRMKYRIIILIIIIISLDKILSSYCKHIMHARMHGRTHAHSRTPPTFAVSVRPTMTAHPFRRWRDNGRSATHWNKQTHWPPDFPEILDVFRE